MEYKVKQLDISSKEEVNELYSCLRDSFKTEYEYFIWKHLPGKSNYLDRFTYCVLHQQKCIATLQIIVSDIYIYERQYCFGLAVDGATVKAHRGHGLYKKLLEYAIKEMSNKNIDFIIAFGNQISRLPLINDYEFLEFTKMISATYIVRYNKVLLTPVNLLRKLIFQFINLLHKNSKYHLTEIDKSIYLGFAKSNLHQFDIYFGKSTDQIEWRLNKPHSNYRFLGAIDNQHQVAGVALINVLDEKIYIEDILSKQNDIGALNYLLNQIKRIAFSELKIKRIAFSSSHSKILKEIFKKCGYKVHELGDNVLIKNLKSDYGEITKMAKPEMHFTRIDKNE